jgi:hypothetical protein
MSETKRHIRIAAVDFGPETSMLTMALELVKDCYDFEITNDRDADYVFHSCYGHDVLEYSGVRIFIVGENVSPNMGISDYAMAFDKMEFGDRYCWMPLIKLYREAYDTFRHPRPPADTILENKTDFCAYVMSSTRDSASERTRIFDLLNEYKTVHSGGSWNNNVGGRVPDKIAFQSSHKFVIAFENSSTLGYLTEKFAEAAQSNAVPIYWGDPTIAQYFNPKAFINCHDFDTLEEVVDYVKHVDQNDRLYLQMIAEPWFKDGLEPECLRDETFVQFLGNIFNQEPEAAFRRNRGRWGLKQERILHRMYSRPLEHGVRLLRKKWLNLYHAFRPRKLKY